jgi:hypothetical protein
VAVEIPASSQVDANGNDEAEQEGRDDDSGRAHRGPREQQERKQAFERRD